MAEAHQAVAFSFSVTTEGVDWNVNAEALLAVWRSGLSYWKTWWRLLQNRFTNGIYPARPGSWMGMVLFVFTMSIFGWDLSIGLVSYLEGLAQRWFHLKAPQDNIIACFWFACAVWFGGVILRKYILMLLLSYTDWMYEIRGPLSLRTKFWHIAVTLLGGLNPRLYSYQGSLPKLPLPKVHDTLQRYLKSIKSITSDEEYQRMKQLAEKFEKNEASRLQRYLFLKSWWASNYVSDWWEEYVYLAGRSPIMVNSNYYGMDACYLHPTKNCAARAANMVHAMVDYMHKLTHEEMKPLMLNDMVPLCSSQYVRQFCTTRVPCRGKDKIVHYDWSNHIAVYHAGRWFRCDFRINDHVLDTAELQKLFEVIIADQSPVDDTEKYLAALTAGERDHWAMARKHYFGRGINRKSLDIIERAAFCLILDDEALADEPKNRDKSSHYAKSLLHGKCYDRWFDKSFNLIVYSNGKAGFNAEHSWADAPVMAQMWEVALWNDFTSPLYGYDDKGNCRGYPPLVCPAPTRLRWDLPPQCMDAIKLSLGVAEKLAADVDVAVLVHDAFGKGLMKTCRVSPDAFIQMALQLAYYRDAKRFCLTYEASMTRLYCDGRTETVRSCSEASCAFVLGMEDKSLSKEERIKLFSKASEYHQQLYRDSMTGKGVDRHLFCLYVISKYLGTESAFLREVLSEPWRLSTSQTPHCQTGQLDLRRHPNFVASGGGFGPVADDGYGVSYMVAGEDIIFFNISSKVSCPTTDSRRFSDGIEQALADIRDLLKRK